MAAPESPGAGGTCTSSNNPESTTLAIELRHRFPSAPRPRAEASAQTIEAV